MWTRQRGWSRGLQAAVAAAAAITLLAGCSGGGGSEPSGESDQGQTQSQPPTPSDGAPGGLVTSFACWGDSLTAGSGGEGTTYPDVLAQLTGLPVFNGGVPGERSSGIAARQGGAPAQTTVVGGSIPAQGGVQVKFAGDVVFIRDEGTLAGTLMDVHGTLSKDQSRVKGKYTFTRDSPGDAVAVPDGTPFITDIGLQYRDAATIIWAGHNDVGVGDPSLVVGNIAKMVEYVQGGHYLVLGLTNGTGVGEGTKKYEEGVLGINKTLQETYGPDHYLDERTWLIQNGLSVAGIQPTAQDQADIAADIVPTSLRDPKAVGHLNAEGYRILAQYIYDFISQQGWV